MTNIEAAEYCYKLYVVFVHPQTCLRVYMRQRTASLLPQMQFLLETLSLWVNLSVFLDMSELKQKPSEGEKSDSELACFTLISAVGINKAAQVHKLSLLTSLNVSKCISTI